MRRIRNPKRMNEKPVRTLAQYVKWMENLRADDPGFERLAKVGEREYFQTHNQDEMYEGEYFITSWGTKQSLYIGDNWIFITEATREEVFEILKDVQFEREDWSAKVSGYGKSVGLKIPGFYSAWLGYDPDPVEIMTVYDHDIFTKEEDGTYLCSRRRPATIEGPRPEMKNESILGFGMARHEREFLIALLKAFDESGFRTIFTWKARSPCFTNFE